MTKLYEANNHILIHTGYADPAEHSHMAAHVIVSLEAEMTVTAAGTEFLCHGVLIPPGVSHRIRTQGHPVLVFLYDCCTDAARSIRALQCIPKSDCDKIITYYLAFEQHPEAGNYRKLEDCLLTFLGITKAPDGITDPRIVSAMEYIHGSLSESLSCKNVAEKVFLSQGRFSHLFRNQVGMTFAAYRIYQRIMYVYAETCRGKSITEAALEAGFSSSSHFADVNRRVFGLSASSITENMVFRKIT